MFGCNRGALALLLSRAAVAVALFFATLHAQSPQPQTTITGRVVAEATGQPVRRAYVVVHGPGTKTTRVTMSDGEGKFTFEGLPNDRYRVGASKRPHLSAATDVNSSDVVLSLPAGAVVTGTIVEETGLPARGLELTISGSAITWPQATTTNHLGEYRFFSLPAGDYEVAAVKRKGDVVKVTVGPADIQHARPLTVPPSEPGEQPVLPGMSPATTGHGMVSGVAVDARTNEPLVDASVVSRGRNLRANTDANGRFRFDGLGPATYTFIAEGRGISPTSAAQVVVTDNTRVSDIRLTGSRQGSIAGSVRDEFGDAVVHMPVVAYLKRTINFQPLLMARGGVQTDDRGLFDIRNLPAGEYLLCACAGEALAIDAHLLRLLGPAAPDTVTVNRLIDNTVLTFAPAFYPGLARASDSQPIVVASGDARTGMDITMRGVKPFVVSGRFVDATGLPATGLRAYLAQDGDLPGAIGLSGSAPVTVGADGSFRFDGIPPATYGLVANSTTPGQRTPWAHINVSVADRDIADLVVPVGEGRTVRGRIDFSGNSAAPKAEALEKSRVIFGPLDISMATFAQMNNGGTVGHSSSINADGSFTVTGLPPGRFHVGVTVPSSPWRTVQRLTSVDAATLDATITVGTTDVNDLLISVTDAPPTALIATVSLDQARYEAIGFIRVVVFPMDEALWLEPERHLTRFGTAMRDRDGSFRVETLPPGDYYVARSSSFDEEMSERSFERWSKTAERVTLKAGETTTVTIRR